MVGRCVRCGSLIVTDIAETNDLVKCDKCGQLHFIAKDGSFRPFGRARKREIRLKGDPKLNELVRRRQLAATRFFPDKPIITQI